MEPGRTLDEFGSIGEPGQIRVVPGTTMLEHQFMDMRILSRIQVDHLLGKLSSPLVPDHQFITGLGSARQSRQVGMAPCAT